MELKTVLGLLVLASPFSLAHPGEQVTQHAARPARRSLAHCEAEFSHPDFVKKSVDRRLGGVQRLREKRGIDTKKKIRRRDWNEVIGTDHLVDADYNENTSAEELFGASGSCMLDPEVTEGPLWVRGEQVRRELTEGENGVLMTIDIQVVDVTDCKPLQDVAVDFWSCNSTGVYGGVLDYPGNGDPNDLALINATTLRGIQFTDAEGIATFDAVVPGHYSGRANHVHAMANIGATKLENNTISGGHISHVGQMYFDQSLLQTVEKTEPYATNTQAWTQNADDFLFKMGAVNDDPVVYYVLVGDTIEEGIFAWIRFGVDPTAERQANPAAYKDENGGHQIGWTPPGWPPKK